MTGQPSVENALSAMKMGAYDYLLKPFDIHSLRRTVERGLERRRLWLENAHLTEAVALYKLSHAATSDADAGELYPLTLNAIQAEFGPDWSVVYGISREGALVREASRGEPGEDEGAFFSGSDPQSLEALATAEVVVHRLRVARNTGDPHTAVYANRVSHPITIRDQVVGLINFQCPPRPEPLYPGDLKTLSILSNQLGAAMENRRLLDTLQSSYLDMVHALASALDARDRTTRDHTDRVCHLAEAIAREMGWTQEKLPELWLGCILHDIGKIGVPDTILQKQGPLTPEEFEMMKTHTVCGARIVQSIPYLKPAVPYILHHHEKYDGSGYPHGLAGDQIPVEARLLAVVDTFDAIISDRPYRKGRSVAVALAEIQAYSGSQFDPRVVDAFMRAWSSGKVDRRQLGDSSGPSPWLQAVRTPVPVRARTERA
jgi:putative nucleotidyltransferase with HDIG domain